jgi:hypothetical protein
MNGVIFARLRTKIAAKKVVSSRDELQPLGADDVQRDRAVEVDDHLDAGLELARNHLRVTQSEEEEGRDDGHHEPRDQDRSVDPELHPEQGELEDRGEVEQRVDVVEDPIELSAPFGGSEDIGHSDQLRVASETDEA